MTTPAQLLGLQKFDEWYPGQKELHEQLKEWEQGPEQYLGLSVPTGYGKSLIGMLLAVVSKRRAVYLTATKGLQTQLMKDFGAIDLHDIRGQNDYPCNQFPRYRVDRAPCHAGYSCPVQHTTCQYFRALRVARRSRLVVTNYSYWMSMNTFNADGLEDVYRDDSGSPIYKPDETTLLICDEAHQASQLLENFLSVQFGLKDRQYIPWQESWNARDWQRALDDANNKAKREHEFLRRELRGMDHEGDRAQDTAQHFRYIKGLQARCTILRDNTEEWIREITSDRASWTPLRIGGYNNHLFQNVPKVVLMSAIFSEPMMESLGIKGTWLDAPSTYPPGNTPVAHVSTTRVDHRMTDKQVDEWVERIDEIIAGRQHLKGLVFTVSYARAQQLAKRSRFRTQMFLHTSQNTQAVVEQFKRAAPPATLVSPSVTTGWDFPGDECRYIIVGKIPFPDSRGAIVKARQAEDKSYTSMLAMQPLVQSAGRGTRSADDTCQVLVVDDTWQWWWPQNRHMAPGWFRERVLGSTLQQSPIQI